MSRLLGTTHSSLISPLYLVVGPLSQGFCCRDAPTLYGWGKCLIFEGSAPVLLPLRNIPLILHVKWATSFFVLLMSCTDLRVSQSFIDGSTSPLERGNDVRPSSCPRAQHVPNTRSSVSIARWATPSGSDALSVQAGASVTGAGSPAPWVTWQEVITTSWTHEPLCLFWAILPVRRQHFGYCASRCSYKLVAIKENLIFLSNDFQWLLLLLLKDETIIDV